MLDQNYIWCILAPCAAQRTRPHAAAPRRAAWIFEGFVPRVAAPRSDFHFIPMSPRGRSFRIFCSITHVGEDALHYELCCLTHSGHLQARKRPSTRI